MVAAGGDQHIRNELSRDRSAALVCAIPPGQIYFRQGSQEPRLVTFLVLPRVREVGNDGRYPPGGGGPASVNHDQPSEFCGQPGPESRVRMASLGTYNSMRPSLISPGSVDCRIKTGKGGQKEVSSEHTTVRRRQGQSVPSSSRTLSPIVTDVSWFE